jgi:ankyrin repeat protein
MARNFADETPFHFAAREGRINIIAYYFNKFPYLDLEAETIVILTIIIIL